MVIEISRVLHLTEFLMFRMFFISFIHASGMTLPLLKRKSGVQGYLESWKRGGVVNVAAFMYVVSVSCLIFLRR